MEVQTKGTKRKPLVKNSNYRHKYNPDWHYRHNEFFSQQEVAYIVQSYRWGQGNNLGLELGRTPGTLMMLMSNVRKDGLWGMYREMDTTSFLSQLEKEEAAFYERTGFSELDE